MFFLSLVLGSGGSPYSDYKGTVSKWQYDVGREVRDLEGSMEFSIEVYRHYGLDLMGMKKKGEEHDWGICEKERTEELTGNMAGFGMEHSQRIIIDYDKD